jgi:hypothetical protein
MLLSEVNKLRAEGFHYVAHDYGQLCLTCATDYDLTGELTFSAEGSCYNCGPNDLESRREAKKRRRNPGRKWPQQPKTLTIWERSALKRIARYGSTGEDDDALLATFRRMPLAAQRRLCPDAAPPRECSAGFTPIPGNDRLVRCDYCTRLVRRTGQAGHKQKCGGWRAQY